MIIPVSCHKCLIYCFVLFVFVDMRSTYDYTIVIENKKKQKRYSYEFL